jgi:hypothetical protein
LRNQHPDRLHEAQALSSSTMLLAISAIEEEIQFQGNEKEGEEENEP